VLTGCLKLLISITNVIPSDSKSHYATPHAASVETKATNTIVDTNSILLAFASSLLIVFILYDLS